MKKLKILLLQARKKNDLMIENELECFSKSLKIEKKYFTIKDLTRDKIKKTDIKKNDLILIGGSGDYSIAKGGYFMKQTIDIMQYLFSISKETFASCWGFQAMAKAMKGEVVNNLKLAELGTIQLKLTRSGTKDPIFGKMPNSFFCQMGHEDIVIKKPKEAIILASSKKIEIEAFRFKNKPIYCTQFHPELRVQDLKKRMKTYPNYIKKILGISNKEFIENHCFESKEAESILKGFVNFYFS
tara:strand:- start:570 stop:1295 length:726 start_codon:yes stop_codon:yes gene_type:complete